MSGWNPRRAVDSFGIQNWLDAHSARESGGALPDAAVTLADREIPLEITLYPSYPNPFNPSTTISFAIPRDEFVTLEVYNLLGQNVASLISARLPSGYYEMHWNAGKLQSGVYFLRLGAGSVVHANKLILAK